MKWTTPYQANKINIVYEQVNEDTHIKIPLNGVESGSVNWNMNTDTKAQASISTINDDYVYPNKIVISLKTPDGVFYLGYYDVLDITEKYKPGQVAREYKLDSVLCRLKEYYSNREIKETTTGDFRHHIKKFLHGSDTGAYLAWDTPADVKTITSDYSIAENALTGYSDLLQSFNYTASTPENFSGNNNTVKLITYVNPHTKEPVYTFGENNGTIEGQIEVSVEMFKCPNYVISKHTFGETDYIATARPPASSPVAGENTKVFRMEVFDENELSPETLEELQNRANKRLEQNCRWKNKYSFTSFFNGLYPSEVVYLEYKGSLLKCVVESLDISLTPSLKTNYVIQETDASLL